MNRRVGAISRRVLYHVFNRSISVFPFVATILKCPDLASTVSAVVVDGNLLKGTEVWRIVRRSPKLKWFMNTGAWSGMNEEIIGAWQNAHLRLDGLLLYDVIGYGGTGQIM